MRLVVLIYLILIGQSAFAHEVRPALLNLEGENGSYNLLWKVPIKDGLVPDVRPEFSDGCNVQINPLAEFTADARIERGSLSCQNLTSIAVPGFKNSLVDVIVRFEDGTHHIIKPGETLTLTNREPPLINDYLLLGFEHILSGWDHLAFVGALLLVVSGGWTVFKTITAFTVGHSITLGLASLGMVTLPSAPVEALIAASIAFLAAEAIAMRQGRQTLTTTYPWVVAILFGLLHGLGFAGALQELGFPEGEIPLALLFFNLGIEAGQLAFVMVLLASIGLLMRLGPNLVRATPLAAYSVGAVGSFWAIERTVSIMLG